MSNVKAPKGKVNAKILVRDKAGHPKFTNEKMVRKFWDVLSEEDKLYLTEKFNLKEGEKWV